MASVAKSYVERQHLHAVLLIDPATPHPWLIVSLSFTTVLMHQAYRCILQYPMQGRVTQT